MITAGQNFTGSSPKAYPIKQGNVKPSILPAGYEAFKAGAKAYGYYKDIRPYLPEERLGNIYKKPVSTSLDFQRALQKILPKKQQLLKTNKFHQESCDSGRWTNNNTKYLSFCNRPR